jgi:hypothetical protein
VSSSLFVSPPIETIDASSVDLGILGHSYYAESERVITDVRGILAGEQPAGRGLCVRHAPAGDYWSFAGASACH